MGRRNAPARRTRKPRAGLCRYFVTTSAGVARTFFPPGGKEVRRPEYVAAKHSPFCSGAASRAAGSRGPQLTEPPVGTRRRSATEHAAAAHSPFCSGAASRAAGSSARNSPSPRRNAEAFRYRNTRQRRIRLFVAARLPVPPGAGPATHRAPVGTRRRSATEYAAAAHSPFCSGAASRAAGSRARNSPSPRRNAEAFRYRIRGGGAFAFL